MTPLWERVLWMVALFLSLPPVPAAQLQAWTQAPFRQAAPALAPLQEALTLATRLQALQAAMALAWLLQGLLLTALQLARAAQLRRCAPVDL